MLVKGGYLDRFVTHYLKFSSFKIKYLMKEWSSQDENIFLEINDYAVIPNK